MKTFLFFFGVLLFSSDEKTLLLLLLTRDFVELLRDERIILRKKQSTLFFGPKNFVVSQKKTKKKTKTKKKKKKTKETQQRRRRRGGGRARKTGKKKRMRTTTTACTTRASVGTSTWRARTTKKTLRKTQRISLRDVGFARKVVVANGVEEDAMTKIKKMKTDKTLGEDEVASFEKKIEELTSSYVKNNGSCGVSVGERVDHGLIEKVLHQRQY